MTTMSNPTIFIVTCKRVYYPKQNDYKMKGKILLTLAIAICIMTGCKKEKQSEQPRQERTAEQSVEQKQTSETSNQEATADKTPRKVKELSFFGHTLILNSEDSYIFSWKTSHRQTRCFP